jgi:hypothetical protein
MSRANISVEDRVPFYLYVDEFQNFATDSFATILSEARKYGLCLTVANQYIAQMMPQVKDAVFGNVGSIVAFRMSADDARTMQRYFEPKFSEHDLVHMHNRHFIVNMTIEGEKSQAFSGITLSLPPTAAATMKTIIQSSRQRYGSPRTKVEQQMNEQYKPRIKEHVPKAPKAVPTPKPGQQAKKSNGFFALNVAGISICGLNNILPQRQKASPVPMKSFTEETIYLQKPPTTSISQTPSTTGKKHRRRRRRHSSTQ